MPDLGVAEPSDKKTDKKPKRSAKSWAGLIALVVVIFAAGWLTGSGKLQLRSYQPNGANRDLPDRLDLSSVDTVYKSLKDNFDGELDEQKLLDGIKTGLAKATGDPYTEYFNPEQASDFHDEIDGVFEGIGAQLGKDADNNIIIVSPIAGYPAEKVGLMPKDVVAEIDGESAFDLTISEAVDKIRGEKGTTVTLTIVRGDQVKEYPIVREQIDIPSVESEVRDGTGIITISRFGDDTVELTRKAAQDFKDQGVSRVILDLRSNPGGYLDGAVAVSSLWLDKGTTVLTERRDNVVVETMAAIGNPVLKGVKTILLINEGSASASEIVAGALKDNNAATLVGQKTFGKGSVQQPINLGDGGLLKVTIARWFTPGGKNIDQAGIEPDTKIEINAEDITAGRDPQLDAALTQIKQ